MSKKYVWISESLIEQIKVTQDQLNEREQEKIRKEKKKWSFVEASDQLGKRIKEVRGN